MYTNAIITYDMQDHYTCIMCNFSTEHPITFSNNQLKVKVPYIVSSEGPPFFSSQTVISWSWLLPRLPTIYYVWVLPLRVTCTG